MEFGWVGNLHTFLLAPPWIACVAGGISMEMLYCFGARADGHVETQTMQTADCADRADCADCAD